MRALLTESVDELTNPTYINNSYTAKEVVENILQMTVLIKEYVFLFIGCTVLFSIIIGLNSGSTIKSLLNLNIIKITLAVIQSIKTFL